jgi:hypothetical protein
VLNNLENGIKMPQFKLWFYYLSVVRPSISYVMNLCLGFLVYKPVIKIGFNGNEALENEMCWCLYTN